MSIRTRTCSNCPRIFLLSKQSAGETLCVLCRAYAHRVETPALAEEHGRADGLADKHYVPKRNYHKPECWIAWLKGWREGQAHRSSAKRSAA